MSPIYTSEPFHESRGVPGLFRHVLILLITSRLVLFHPNWTFPKLPRRLEETGLLDFVSFE